MTRKRLKFMNIAEEDVLTRDEMKNTIAGSGGNNDCAELGSTITNEEFIDKVGCTASGATPQDTCDGTDGCTYNSAVEAGSSTGSS